MKRNENIINLADIMRNGDIKGMGAQQGKLAFEALSSIIDRQPKYNTFYIALDDTFFDASFAREGIVKLAKHYRMSKGICLINIDNEDLLDNVLSPVLKLNQPIAYYVGEVLHHVFHDKIGAPSKTNKPIFEFILSKGSTTAHDVSKEFDMKLNNASTKLKTLFEEGYLLRNEEKSETGGIEFTYYTIS
jgi:hypothetical protein